MKQLAYKFAVIFKVNPIIFTLLFTLTLLALLVGQFFVALLLALLFASEVRAVLHKSQIRVFSGIAGAALTAIVTKGLFNE